MQTSLRLVSFNILEGLRTLARTDTERRHLDRDRAVAARSAVATLDLDILVLNEALFCRSHAGRKVDYAGCLPFPTRRQRFMTAHGAMPS